MKQYIIDEALAQAIANYLSTRPYTEVFQLIPALMQIKPLGDVNENRQD